MKTSELLDALNRSIADYHLSLRQASERNKASLARQRQAMIIARALLSGQTVLLPITRIGEQLPMDGADASRSIIT